MCNREGQHDPDQAKEGDDAEVGHALGPSDSGSLNETGHYCSPCWPHRVFEAGSATGVTIRRRGVGGIAQRHGIVSWCGFLVSLEPTLRWTFQPWGAHR